MQTAAAQPEGGYLNASLFLTRFDKLTQVLRSRDLLRALLYHRVLGGGRTPAGAIGGFGDSNRYRGQPGAVFPSCLSLGG
ncbi:MAG: hypothetical protein JRF60_14795 [Deltaproteobacteria bacterium]|nr:hypothetical protein [Deltaproteobacteria bacterium]